MLSYQALMTLRSDVKIDIVVPAAEKDLDVLPLAVSAARRHVRHPIQRVFVISPASPGVRAFCKRFGCSFVDERALIDLQPSEINLVVDGVDRSTWIYQQFLKWSADSIVESPHFLVVDADTVFVRPQVFERNGRIVFNYSDERHQPYFDMYTRLLCAAALCPTSFTSHQMLYDASILIEMKLRIEALHGCRWYDAILENLDRGELSAFSDYETYGQYVFGNYSSRMALEYWGNLSLPRKGFLSGVRRLSLKYGGKYKSVSFHTYSD